MNQNKAKSRVSSQTVKCVRTEALRQTWRARAPVTSRVGRHSRARTSRDMSSAEGSAAWGDLGPPAVASERRRDAKAVGALVDSLSMPPPAPRAARRTGPVVLDEDEYVARLDAIITRDYFPDVPKLRDTLRWLEATNSGDPARVREAQRAIQRRLHRERGAGTGAGCSPSFSLRLGDANDDVTVNTVRARSERTRRSGWETDGEDEWIRSELSDPRNDLGGGVARSAPSTPSRGLASAAAAEAEDAAFAAVAAADARLGIDGFLRAYTGEDNASFARILERRNATVQKKIDAWANRNRAAAARAAAEGFGTAQGTGTALTFPMEPVRNELFFRHGGGAERKTSLGVRSAGFQSTAAFGPPAATVARNTRFENVLAPSRSSRDETPSVITTARHPEPEPYSTVATPHIEPGANESPFITWGVLESTPARLDGPTGASSFFAADGDGDAPGQPPAPAPRLTPRASQSPFRLAGVDHRERALRRLVGEMDHGKSSATGAGAKRKRGTPGHLSEAVRSAARRAPRLSESTPRRSGVDASFEGSLRRAYAPSRTPRRPASTSATPARDAAKKEELGQRRLRDF